MKMDINLARRQLLMGASVLVLSAIDGKREQATSQNASIPDNSDVLAELSAVDAVKSMSNGDLTAERYAQALLERSGRYASLNAFITIEPDRVLEAARNADRRRASGEKLGLLHGLPIPIKDSVNTKDYPTTAGTAALRSFRPKQNAAIVDTLIAAGATVMGKTNLHELSYGYTSNNPTFGPVHNPYEVAHIPGGSSGGTAVEIAARLAPLGVAEDTVGSIRVPAALCGIVGFRPTTGRYPAAGVVPLSHLFDQVGPEARTVSDIALFDAAVTGDRQPLAPLPLKGVKLAVPRYFYRGIDPEVHRVARAALEKLRGAGAELVYADMPNLGKLLDLITGPIINHDLRTEMPQYLKTWDTGITFEELLASASPDIADDMRKVLIGGSDFESDRAYRSVVDKELPKLRQMFKQYYATTGATATVFPATMTTATRIGAESKVTVDGRSLSLDDALSRNIEAGSTTGLPGLVLPVGFANSGLPVGFEFDGPRGSDRTLLSLGFTIESILGPLPPPRLI